MVGSVRGSRSRRAESRALAANHDVRIAVARVDQARAIFDDVQLDRYPTVTAGAVADRRSEAIPGFHDEPRDDLHLSRRLRRVLGARRVRPDPQPGALGGRHGRELRRPPSTTCGSAWRRKWRATTSSCAACSSGSRWPSEASSNQQETLRLTQVRRDAGIGEEQDVASAAARVAAIEAEHPADPKRDRAARASPCGADRDTAGRARVSISTPRPYPVLAKALRDRRAGLAASSPSRCARGGASSCGIDGE